MRKTPPVKSAAEIPAFDLFSELPALAPHAERPVAAKAASAKKAPVEIAPAKAAPAKAAPAKAAKKIPVRAKIGRAHV